MQRWLFKQEPGCYSFSDLERDGATNWDGVANALALKHLRTVQPGDQVFFYHTGKEKAVVGVMEVVDGPLVDPEDATNVVVQVKPVCRLKKPVTLAAIKADEKLSGWDLTRLPRLSVVPVSDEQWKRVEKLAAS